MKLTIHAKKYWQNMYGTGRKTKQRGTFNFLSFKQLDTAFEGYLQCYKEFWWFLGQFVKILQHNMLVKRERDKPLQHTEMC